MSESRLPVLSSRSEPASHDPYQKTGRLHPAKPQSGKNKSIQHWQHQVGRIGQELVNEITEKPQGEEQQNESRKNRYQNGNRLEPQRGSFLRQAQVARPAARANLGVAGIRVETRAEFFVIAAAASIAKKRIAACDMKALITKAHLCP